MTTIIDHCKTTKGQIIITVLIVIEAGLVILALAFDRNSFTNIATAMMFMVPVYTIATVGAIIIYNRQTERRSFVFAKWFAIAALVLFILFSTVLSLGAPLDSEISRAAGIATGFAAIGTIVFTFKADFEKQGLFND